MVANGAKLDINISARWSPEIRDFLTKALLLQECLDPKMWDIEVKLRALLSGLTPDMLEVFQERLECTIPKLRLLYPQKISFYKHLIKLLGGDISKNQALTPKEKQEALKGILNDPELLGKIAGACTAIKTPAPKTLVYSAALELIQSMSKRSYPTKCN
ncbi:MAG UNVERIFIED_CONTAM: hypothetical protein LVQ98_04865 [Rickettsiaceae bacterium]